MTIKISAETNSKFYYSNSWYISKRPNIRLIYSPKPFIKNGKKSLAKQLIIEEITENLNKYKLILCGKNIQTNCFTT